MSQPRVFISLGRTGQVVERRRTASNSRETRCDDVPQAGSKRSTRDGLRIYPRDSFVSNKRQRGDGTYWGAHENTENEMGLTPKDLRLKLLRQRMGHVNQNVVKSAVPSPSNGRLQSKSEAEARESFHPRQISYTKNADHIHLGDSSLNEAGARSSDIQLNSSRAAAPLINDDGQQRFSFIHEFK